MSIAPCSIGLRESGWLTIDCAAGQVRVDAGWWRLIDVEGKSTLVARVERACAGHRAGHEFVVRDMRGGDELSVGNVSWREMVDR